MKLRFSMAMAVLLAVSAMGSSAYARPPLRLIDLQVGKDEFFRVGKGTLAVVDAPELLAFEVLPSDEILISPKAPGRALLFLMVDSRFEAVRVRVREVGGKPQELHASEAQLAAARKACPRLTIERGGQGASLDTEIPTGACRTELLKLLETDDFLADRVSVMFSEEVIREQYLAISARAAKQGLDKVFQLAYLGVTLRIKGKATAAQKMALLQIAYEETPGRVLLDDQSELVEEAPAAAAVPGADDAGLPAARP